MLENNTNVPENESGAKTSGPAPDNISIDPVTSSEPSEAAGTLADQSTTSSAWDPSSTDTAAGSARKDASTSGPAAGSATKDASTSGPAAGSSTKDASTSGPAAGSGTDSGNYDRLSNEETTVDPPKPKKKKEKNRVWKIIVGLLVLSAVAAYAVGVYFYNTHFFHNVTVNGTHIGEMTIPQAERVFTEDFTSHRISIIEKERTEYIDARAVGTVIDVGSQIKDLQESQNPWLWFMNLTGKENDDVTLTVSFDDSLLRQTIRNLDCFIEANVTPPADTYITPGQNQFEIVPEVLGNKVKQVELYKIICEALTNGVTSINLEDLNLYELPVYYSKDEVVQKALVKANKYTSGTLTYDFDYKLETLDYQTTKDWINISDKFKVTIDKDKLGTYVDNLCKTYNTMGDAHIFTTSGGQQIRITDGDYGWKINFEKEKEALLKDIKEGKTENREPIYEYRAMCRESEDDDIGGSYVEVSLTAQELWLYDNGSCIMNSSVVTGNPKKNAGTTPGIYGITYKQSPATLTGPNANGSSYSSDVTYWMPFNGNQGLHDAPWRNDFGGNIYLRNGSHGCINCPYDTAETLYQYVSTGFPVIIY